jgi:Outer membrane protein beta-barrel domain
MKQLFIFALALVTITTAFAQKDSTIVPSKKKDWSKVNLGHRANDHFMVQIGYDNWANTPDSINITGFSRSFNFYFMFDMPFKTDPRFSVGAGLGIGSSNIFFHDQFVDVAATGNSGTTLAFTDQSGGNHYKKFKLVSTYVEVPLELRYAIDPENTNKSWKFAVGVKTGLLLSAYTKAKDLENNANQSINSYIQKESSKRYFNGARIAGTARISYGVFGIFGQLQATSFIKNGAGPAVYPFSVGICFSGL